MKLTSAKAISRIISERLSGKGKKDELSLSGLAKKVAQRMVESSNENKNENKNEEKDENVKH